MSETGTVRYAVEDGVATITIDRPDKHNALTAAMQRELSDLVIRAGEDDSVGAVLLHGAGRSFCAGVDVKEQRGPVKESRARGLWHRDVGSITAAIAAIPIPVIAAIRGHALGRGFDLAVAADIRIVAPSARFAYPEVARGMIVGGGGPRRLARLIGESRTADLLLSGARMDADTALASGFATRSADEDLLESEAYTLAKSLAEQPSLALYAAKATLRQSGDVSAAAGAWTDSALNVLGLREP